MAYLISFLIIVNIIVLAKVFVNSAWQTINVLLLKRLYTLLAYNKINLGQFRVLLNDLNECESTRDYQLFADILRQFERD